MARSGDFGTSNQYIKYYIEAIQNWQDVTGNLSNVTVRVWVYRTNNYTTWGTGTVSVNINGSVYSSGINTSQRITMTPIVVFERNLNIGHNADGTGYVDISAIISHNSPFSSGWNGWQMGLTTIPRASQPTLSDYGYITMGSGQLRIATNRASSSFTHTLRYVFGNQSGIIATDVTTDYLWTLPLSLANAIPNATEGWGSIIVETYNGGSYIGSASVRFNASVPDSIKPTIDNVVISEKNEQVKTLNTGSYVQNLSWLYVEVRSTSQYSAGISSTKVTFDNFTYNNWTFETNVIRGSGTLTMNIEVTDTRGRKTSTTRSISVMPYATPSISTFSLSRANSDGKPNQLGSYAKITRGGTFSALGGKNTLTVRLESKLRSANTWTKVNEVSGVTTEIYNNTVVLGNYSASSSYDFRLSFIDKFNTTTAILALSTGQTTLSLGKTGVGIGKIWEQGALDVYGDVNVDGSITVTNGKKIVFPHLINGTTPVSPLGIATDGSAVKLTEGTDLNTVKTTGIYMCNNAVNRPSSIANWVYIEVIQHDNSFLSQRVTSLWDGRVFQRVLANNNWSAWKQYSTVESSGANANGNYIRYTDGMQICWLNRSFNGTGGMWRTAVSYPSGFYYMYMSGTWTFPASFSAPPATFASGDITGAMSETHTSFGANNSTCSWESGTFSIGGVDVSAPALSQTFLAIGRWS